MVAAFSERAPREPKYYIVKRHLLDLINTLPPGSLVPTERVLTAELGTSRTTVRQALSELVGEGRLMRRQGSGTYVAEPKISWPLQMTSFTEQAAANGYTATAQLLDARRVRASEDVAHRLSIKAGGASFCIERLRLVDDTPMAVETSHLSAARFPGLITELRKSGSLYRVLSEVYGVEPVDRRGDHRDRRCITARGRTAQHRHRLTDARTLAAQLRRRWPTDRVGAKLVSRRPLRVRRQTLGALSVVPRQRG